MADNLLGISPINDIFRVKPTWSKITDNFDYTVEIFKLVGTVQEIHKWSDYVSHKLKMDFVSLDKIEEKTLYDFYIGKKGKLNKFWTLSFKSDFILTADSAANVLIVENNDFDKVFKGYERIFILMKDGDLITRKILSVTDGPTENELQITVETNFDRIITSTNYRYIGFLFLCRFDTDELNLKYINNSVTDVQLSFMELVNEYQYLD